MHKNSDDETLPLINPRIELETSIPIRYPADGPAMPPTDDAKTGKPIAPKESQPRIEANASFGDNIKFIRYNANICVVIGTGYSGIEIFDATVIPIIAIATFLNDKTSFLASTRTIHSL